MAKVYIGTSGWVYSDWKGAFYPQDLPQRKWLEFYGQQFKTVEVNSTFYHSMRPATFENWAKAVPDNFVFAVKASRFITHVRRLEDIKSSMIQIIEPALRMSKKLGPILFQLPPRFKADGKRLERFLQTASHLRGESSSHLGGGQKLRYAFEFRDPSWFDETIYQVLRKYNAAVVIAESGGYWPSSASSSAEATDDKEAPEGKPSEEVITADFTYIRFHGEGGSYATSYTDQELTVWAKKIKKWQEMGIDVYAYFNNDVNAFAVDNAKTLSNLIE